MQKVLTTHIGDIVKYKYYILGNITSICGFGAIAAANIDWRLSLGLGITGGILGNYMFFSIKKDVYKSISPILNKYSNYVGYEIRDNKLIKVEKKDIKNEDISEFLD